MPGLLIDSITSGSQAETAGLRVHDVLYKYNGTLLNITEDLLGAISDGKVENEITVIRGRELLEITVLSGPLGIVNRPYPAPDIHIDGVGEVLARFRDEDQGKNAAEKEAQQAERLRRIAGIQLTTTPQLDGYRVTRTVDIISAEYVGGINMFRDILGIIADLKGGRSGTLQNELRKAREVCLTSLKDEADRIGANAVIGVDLDYSEISGGGKSMLFLVASGTAVIVEKL